jgi:tetratricopeptide (TPR) repeat protein
VIRIPLLQKVLAAGLFLALLGTARVAHADDDGTTTAAARERFKEGVTYFDQKQYEKARAAFLQAYALKKHPAVLLNLAQSELRSSHERDAAQHFTEYLREATDASQGERDAAQAGLVTARAAICEVTLITDADADVSVDGTPQGPAPLSAPIFLDPGTHTLQAKKGDRVANQTITAKAGESRELKLKLANETVPAVAAKPASASAPPPTTEPEAVPEEPARRTGGREPFMHWLLTKPAGVISGSATLLLGGGAVGFAIASHVNYSNADDIAQQINDRATVDGVSTQGICVDPNKVLGPGNEAEAARFADACSHHQDSVNTGDSYKTVATVVGIGAGVMAVTTVVLYFVTADDGQTAKSTSPSHFAVLPWFDSKHGGLTVAGRF